MSFHLRRSFMMGSLTSSESSFHFGGNGRRRFIFRRGVRQVGIGHLSRLKQCSYISCKINRTDVIDLLKYESAVMLV